MKKIIKTVYIVTDGEKEQEAETMKKAIEILEKEIEKDKTWGFGYIQI